MICFLHTRSECVCEFEVKSPSSQTPEEVIILDSCYNDSTDEKFNWLK